MPLPLPPPLGEPPGALGSAPCFRDDVLGPCGGGEGPATAGAVAALEVFIVVVDGGGDAAAAAAAAAAFGIAAGSAAVDVAEPAAEPHHIISFHIDT